LKAYSKPAIQSSRGNIFPGYPNRILLGDFQAAIRPKGKTAADRRASRSEIWTQRSLFDTPFTPYRKMENDHSTHLTFTFAGKNPLQGGLTVSARLRGRPKIERVEANGCVQPYTVATDNCSSHLFIDFENVEPGIEQKIHIDF
jgi:hypothetical protein